MKNLFIATVFILFLVSCITEQKSERSELYLDTLTLNYNKALISNDWIEIDELRFLHVFNDTLDTNISERKQNDKEFELPTSINYIKVEGFDRFLRDDYTNYQMAVFFLRALQEFELKNIELGNENIYKYVGPEYELFEGKVRIVRIDSKKIRVSHDKGYQSIVGD